MFNTLFERAMVPVPNEPSKSYLIAESFAMLFVTAIKLFTTLIGWIFVLSALAVGSFLTAAAAFASNTFFEGSYWLGTPEGMLTLGTLSFVSVCLMVVGVVIAFFAEVKKQA